MAMSGLSCGNWAISYECALKTVNWPCDASIFGLYGQALAKSCDYLKLTKVWT